VTARGGPGVRAVLDEAVLHTVLAHGYRARVVDLPEGDEIEVLCAPRLPVAGARFFLRVEATALPRRPGRTPPRASVAARLAAAWRAVPEPVAVVGIDPRTGSARIGVVPPRAGTSHGARRAALRVPLTDPLDGPALPRLARRAADAHVLFRRVLAATARPRVPADAAGGAERLREADFHHTLACVDLLREAGLVEEDGGDRTLRPTEPCMRAFAEAAVHHGLGARGHADPRAAAEAGRAAVARLVLSRLPGAAESTAARCAVVLARLLPVDDADAIVDLVRASAE
jgi:hypothetical protein